MNERVTFIAVLAYGVTLCAVGFVGIFLAPRELSTVFHLPVSDWAPDVRATMLNQYRFLKGLELGGGIGCLFFAREIVAGGHAGKWFLALVGAGVSARTLAWVTDGRPSVAFQVFLVLELLVFVVTLTNLRGRLHHD